jgi:hypothetical protein
MICLMQGDFYAPYLKNFLKKLITQVECDRGCVLDQFYELYAQYITSFKVYFIYFLYPLFILA